MKTSPSRQFKSGFASYLIVLSTGAVLSLLMVSTYRRVVASQVVQGQVQLRVDYNEKEEAILRSIVALTSNAAVRAMEDPTDPSGTWAGIFQAALDTANAGRSIDAGLAAVLPVGQLANSGDSTNALGNSALTVPGVFNPNYTPAVPGAAPFVTSGTANLGADFPPRLFTDAATRTQDALSPVIRGPLASGGQKLPSAAAGTPRFGTAALIYPDINFGFTTPGNPFVAKRNWWTFSINAAKQDENRTGSIRSSRQFVLSVYEVPAQSPITAAGTLNIGQFENKSTTAKGAEKWAMSNTEAAGKVRIAGRIFANKAKASGDASFEGGLATRSGADLTDSTGTIGGIANNTISIAAGERETFLTSQTNSDIRFPVSEASESGRAVFVPITAGDEFYNRWLGDPADEWLNYKSGARQCNMHLDVVSFTSGLLECEFTYRESNGSETTIGPFTVDSSTNDAALNNAFKTSPLTGGLYINVHLDALKTYISGFTGADADRYNSLSVNIKNTPTTTISGNFKVALKGSRNLTSYVDGFSLVTELPVVFAGDFNLIPYPPASSNIFPACSIFAKSKTFSNANLGKPLSIKILGQAGSTRKSLVATDTVDTLETPLENGGTMARADVTVNLEQITDPNRLPPISLMNWLVVLDEVGR